MSIIKNNYKNISLIILFFFLIFKVSTTSFPLFQVVNPIINIIKGATDPILNRIDRFFEYYFVFVDNNKEINKLRKEKKVLLLKNSILSVYESEIENMKKILNLKKNYLSFELIPVVNIRSNNKEFLSGRNISNELIKEGYGVMSDDGVVGVVSSTINDRINIIPFFSKKSSIPVWVGKKKIFALATGNGDNSLILRLKYVEKSTIKIKDKIVTNGYDSIFPENIPIGEVRNIKNIKNNLFVDVEVFSYSKLNSRYFYVLKK